MPESYISRKLRSFPRTLAAYKRVRSSAIRGGYTGRYYRKRGMTQTRRNGRYKYRRRKYGRRPKRGYGSYSSQMYGAKRKKAALKAKTELYRPLNWSYFKKAWLTCNTSWATAAAVAGAAGRTDVWTVGANTGHMACNDVFNPSRTGWSPNFGCIDFKEYSDRWSQYTVIASNITVNIEPLAGLVATTLNSQRLGILVRDNTGESLPLDWGDLVGKSRQLQYFKKPNYISNNASDSSKDIVLRNNWSIQSVGGLNSKALLNSASLRASVGASPVVSFTYQLWDFLTTQVTGAPEAMRGFLTVNYLVIFQDPITQ